MSDDDIITPQHATRRTSFYLSARSPAAKLFLVVVLLSAPLNACSKNISYTKNIPIMDTFVRIEVRRIYDEKSAGEAMDNAVVRMKNLASELDCKSGECVKNANTEKVLEEAARVKGLTEGVFDIGFKNNGKIDLGGIAKGFIVDEGIRVLKRYGIEEAIIDAGGDMYCMGKYKIGIRDPRSRREIMGVFSVCDRAVATSAAYERGAHIIDPRKGHAVVEPGKSVTVTAENCMRADALATALYVLEPQKGLSIIEELDDTECLIIDETGKIYVSDGLKDSFDKRMR